MNRFPDGRRSDGFTLIEVLIAFVILGIASLGLYRGMTTGLSGTEVSEARTAALLHARSKLDEVGASIVVTPGTVSGTFADGLLWTVDITPFHESEPAPALNDLDAPAVVAFQVVVVVKDRHGFPVALTSYRLAPAP